MGGGPDDNSENLYVIGFIAKQGKNNKMLMNKDLFTN
ncbi:hypothetical protein MAMMFC1_03331 [Methylomusa anaerophila]|uniref:Uncharacterized protein n=1 Tax=Methylomusa anaerophila TaxID=1930071 RepID=A0A348ANI8_9FIRM|nr:hypothetical protein MAMMFC1_03331 [Methylomusa anaerophila]